MDKDIVINLYKKQFRIICLYLVKCGCKVCDAEDVVHDSFVKAIEYMDGVEIKNLSSWLFKVSLNDYKNRVKRGKILVCVSVDEENFYNELIEEKTVEAELLNKEKSKEIKATLNELKEEYRALLIFKYEMNLSYRDIGLLLGINEGTVKTYLYRARNKFKDVWQKNNKEEGV